MSKSLFKMYYQIDQDQKGCLFSVLFSSSRRDPQVPLISCFCWWQIFATTSLTCRARCTVGQCTLRKRTFLWRQTAGETQRTVWMRDQGRIIRNLHLKQADGPKGTRRENQGEREQTDHTDNEGKLWMLSGVNIEAVCFCI